MDCGNHRLTTTLLFLHMCVARLNETSKQQRGCLAGFGLMMLRFLPQHILVFGSYGRPPHSANMMGIIIYKYIRCGNTIT